jgi:hypothetical protein
MENERRRGGHTGASYEREREREKRRTHDASTYVSTSTGFSFEASLNESFARGFTLRDFKCIVSNEDSMRGFLILSLVVGSVYIADDAIFYLRQNSNIPWYYNN